MKFSRSLVLALLLSPFASLAQSTEKGDYLVSGGAGLGIYNTYINEKDSTRIETDKTAAWVFPVGVEYMITDRFGCGAFLKYGKYIEGDSSNNADVHAIEFMVRPAFHLYNGRKLNIGVHADLGFTNITYNVNDTYSTTGTGFGLLYGLGADLQLYFTKGFGMFFRYSYYSFTYNNFTVDNNQPNQEPVVYKFKLDGGNSVLGIMVKF